MTKCGHIHCSRLSPKPPHHIFTVRTTSTAIDSLSTTLKHLHVISEFLITTTSPGHHGPANPPLHPPLRRSPAPAPPPRTRSRRYILLPRFNSSLRLPVNKTYSPSHRLRAHWSNPLTMSNRDGRSRGRRVRCRSGHCVPRRELQE